MCMFIEIKVPHFNLKKMFLLLSGIELRWYANFQNTTHEIAHYFLVKALIYDLIQKAGH